MERIHVSLVDTTQFHPVVHPQTIYSQITQPGFGDPHKPSVLLLDGWHLSVDPETGTACWSHPLRVIHDTLPWQQVCLNLQSAILLTEQDLIVAIRTGEDNLFFSATKTIEIGGETYVRQVGGLNTHSTGHPRILATVQRRRLDDDGAHDVTGLTANGTQMWRMVANYNEVIPLGFPAIVYYTLQVTPDQVTPPLIVDLTWSPPCTPS